MTSARCRKTSTRSSRTPAQKRWKWQLSEGGILRGRQHFIGFLGGFHGRTMGALSFTSSKSIYRKNFAPSMPGVIHIPFCTPYRPILANPEGKDYGDVVLDYLEEVIFAQMVSPHEIAGVLLEPIQGEGGYVVPTPNFFPRLREICSKYGIMLITDEVQSGMGRTGRWWALPIAFGLNLAAAHFIFRKRTQRRFRPMKTENADLAGEIANVKALAEEGRNAPLVGGVIYVIWGAAIGIAAHLSYLRYSGVLNAPFLGGVWFWVAALGVGWAASFTIGKRAGGKPGALTVGRQDSERRLVRDRRLHVRVLDRRDAVRGALQVRRTGACLRVRPDVPDRIRSLRDRFLRDRGRRASRLDARFRGRGLDLLDRLPLFHRRRQTIPCRRGGKPCLRDLSRKRC